MTDKRLPADTLFIVAEEDFRFEEPLEEKRQREAASAAEPSAAAEPPPSDAAEAPESRRYEGTWSKAACVRMSMSKGVAMKWSRQDQVSGVGVRFYI